MSPDTKVKLAELSELSIGQLAAKYEKLFGEKCRSRNRRYVYRRVAWKMQADDEGGLSERAILRATVIAGPVASQWTPNGESLVLVAPNYDSFNQKPSRIDLTFWNSSTDDTRQIALAADASLRLDSANLSHDGRYLFLQDRTFGASEIWAIHMAPPTRVGFSRAEDFGPTAEKPFAVLGENPVTQRLWKLDTPLDQAP